MANVKTKGKPNTLFGPGPSGWLNACVGRNGGFPGFHRIACGYFEAGEILVKRLQEDSRHLDCLIYPLAQTYRHGIETMLKELVPLLTRLCEESDKVRLTHKLIDNWNIARKHLIALEVEQSEFADVDWILADLVEIDATGETFRYPHARDGSPHLETTRLINMEVFADGMTLLKEFFDACHCWATEMLDRKLEIESNLTAAWS
jgi:hypothetical protein